MKASILVRLATSGALFAITTVGCSTVTPGNLSSVSDAPRPAKSAAKAQAKAQKALADGRNDDAIGFAEAAVLTEPGNPALRSLLGQSYLAAGRFASAGDSFRESMTLGREDARSVIGLVLADTAQGHVGAARELLSANRDMLPVADYGLALAMTGDSTRAVEVLTDAIRLDAGNAKTRQNLALAYALDGRWREARIMASQDMSADQVEKRISSWAQMARPGAYETRVAGLLGVTAVADAGRPIGLALDFSSQPQTEMVAAVELPRSDAPLPAVGPAPTAGGTRLFAAQEDNVVMASAGLPVSRTPTPRATQDVRTAMSQEAMPAQPVAERRTALVVSTPPVIKAPVRAAKSVKTPTRLASAAAAPAAAGKRSTAVGGTHLVQIGAFSSRENAAKAWAIYQRRYPTLKRYDNASAQVKVKGRTLYRLAATGFDDAASANSLCSTLKSEGGKCLVRNMRGAGSVQYAAGTLNGRLLALR